MKHTIRDMVELSFYLRMFRAKYGLGQKELAKKIGCRVEEVCRWESCKHFPNMESLRKLKKIGIS